MNQIKSAVNNKQTLCVGCLSVDRKLFKLNNTELYYSLLGEQYDNELKCLKLELCWECVALLNRITLFQRRIQNAQIILRSLDILKKTKLSTLSIKHKNYYDVTIDYEEEKIRNAEYSIPNEIIDVKPCSVVKQEIVEEAAEEKKEDLKEENFEELFTDDRYSDVDMCDGDASLKKKKKKKKGYTRKYERSVKIKINDIDMDNFGQYFNGGLCKIYEEPRKNRKKKSKSLNDAFPEECAVRSCKLCGFECRTRLEQLRHLKRQHRRSYCCKVCGCSYNTMDEFQKHYKELHTILFCDYCGKKFVKRGSFEAHIRLHTEMPKLKCDICSKEYREKWALRLHMLSHDEKHKEAAFCAECGIQFKTIYTYRAHLRNTRKHVAAEDLKHKCPHCEKRFPCLSVLKFHSDSMHSDAYYTCNTCNEMFKTTKNLRNHVREKHEGKAKPRNKVCEICSRAFNTSRTLANHIRTHSGERPFVCEYCNANFAQKAAMRSHVKHIHLKIKRRAC